MEMPVRMVVAAMLWGVFCQGRAASGHPTQRSCHLVRLKAMLIDALPGARELQHKYERGSNQHRCQEGFQLKKFPECNLKGKERLSLTLSRLSLTTRVLENETMEPNLVTRNLETFNIFRSELAHCEAAESSTTKSCQRHLKNYAHKVSSECLRHEVLFNLVWTLCEDVGFVIPGDHHHSKALRESPPVTPRVRAQKKRKGKRKDKKSGAQKARRASQLKM